MNTALHRSMPGGVMMGHTWERKHMTRHRKADRVRVKLVLVITGPQDCCHPLADSTLVSNHLSLGFSFCSAPLPDFTLRRAWIIPKPHSNHSKNGLLGWQTVFHFLLLFLSIYLLEECYLKFPKVLFLLKSNIYTEDVLHCWFTSEYKFLSGEIS